MGGMKPAPTLILCGLLGLLCDRATAQTTDNAAAEPKVAEGPAPQDQPASQQPATADPPPASGDAPPAAAPAPTPAAAANQPAQAAAPASDPASEPAAGPDPQPEYYEPPPPPAPEDDAGGGIPGFSVRIDPFNWLLAGRLGLELEVEVWKFISIELVPVFVTGESPPLFNFGGRDENLTQHSDGLGPISGTSVGVGFWFSGKPLKGMVLRGIFTNYAYNYEARDNGVLVDGRGVGHTEQHLGATLGSYNRYGAFILGGEFGLTTDLNDEERCLPENGPGCDQLQLRAFDSGDPAAPDPRYYDLNGGFHPIYLEFRFSLGVAID